MSDLPQEFDLKFLPDWLKEGPVENRYANYEGESGDRPRRDRDDRRGPGGPRPPRRGGPPPRGDSRGGGQNKPQGDRARGPGDRGRGPKPGGDRPREGRPQERRDDSRPREESRDAPRQAPVSLKIEFLPEPNAAAGIARQIKGSGRAYAVFSTSKLFLEKPERHRVRITSIDPSILLYQIGEGPVSLDRSAVERNAFFSARDEFYKEETIQGEPIKGNFTNVARCRSTGTLLGPTNHHGYQPALRKLYEERFSRRISFQEFQRDEIETVSDEQTVSDWKEQARSSTTFTTLKEAEPIIFKSAFDAEQHFKKTYLPQLVKSAAVMECTGPASRAGLDRQISNAVRAAWEAESRFPQQVVNGLRPFLMEAGLHFFKHRKRILFVSATKPVRHATGQVFSDGITAILQALEASPRLKRPELAAKLLGADQESPEAVARKAQLASDLHYLIHIGHVIEFADGVLELPLSPNANPPPERKPAAPRQERPAAAATPAEISTVVHPNEEGSSTPEGEPDDGAPLADSEAITDTSASEESGQNARAPLQEVAPESNATVPGEESVAEPEPDPEAGRNAQAVDSTITEAAHTPPETSPEISADASVELSAAGGSVPPPPTAHPSIPESGEHLVPEKTI